MATEQDDKKLFEDAMRAVSIFLDDARKMSTLYSRLNSDDPKFIGFGLRVNYDLLNAIGDVFNAHDAHDEDDPENGFIESVLERLAARFPQKATPQ